MAEVEEPGEQQSSTGFPPAPAAALLLVSQRECTEPCTTATTARGRHQNQPVLALFLVLVLVPVPVLVLVLALFLVLIPVLVPVLVPDLVLFLVLALFLVLVCKLGFSGSKVKRGRAKERMNPNLHC